MGNGTLGITRFDSADLAAGGTPSICESGQGWGLYLCFWSSA